MVNILIINASLNAEYGNTEKLLNYMKENCNVDVETVYLKYHSYNELKPKLDSASAFIIGTGVYWSNHSSLLQKFLEDATSDELSKTFLGKPVGFIITNHSFGASSTVSKLIMSMNLLGCMIPPLGFMNFNYAIQDKKDIDLWKKSDCMIVLNNILFVLGLTKKIQVWDIDNSNFNERWII